MTDKSETSKISEVISYIFARLTDQPTGKLDTYFKTKMRQELEEAGFDKDTINRALDWLNSLLEQQLLGLLRSASAANFPDMHNPQAVRCYTAEERLKLNTEVRGFILQLEQDGMLDWITREIIITQLMQLDQNAVKIEDFYWVVFMVMCSNISKGSKAEQREYLKSLLALLSQAGSQQPTEN